MNSGRVSQGPKVKEFEESIAKSIGVKYAVAVSNCTNALHLANISIGISLGDEVLVADYTFPATGHSVLYCGATPVFVDNDPKTYNIDPTKIEEFLLKEKPDLVIMYNNTNSTFAGALAEAGLRSFDRTMPEEINRVLIDHISDVLFCLTQTAVDNLRNEGITRGVHLVGDVMVDALEFNKGIAEDRSQILERLRVVSKQYLVITVHRPANTDSREYMENIIGAVGEARMPVVFPVHPRTKKFLEEYGMWNRLPANIIVTEPLGYLDMLKLIRHACKILTDSGGIHKEAHILSVPCITLRDGTEWVETMEDGGYINGNG